MSEEKYNALKELCQNRTSVRHFSDKPVPPEMIEKILEIATTSPYASGRKNWDVIVLDDSALIKQLADSVSEYLAGQKKLIRKDCHELYDKYIESFTFFQNAPLIFVPCYRVSTSVSYLMKEQDQNILQWERDNFTKSISCVSMLIVLAAHSLGLGSCYMTGPLMAAGNVKKLIKVRTGREIGSFIPVGYPKEE